MSTQRTSPCDDTTSHSTASTADFAVNFALHCPLEYRQSKEVRQRWAAVNELVVPH